VKSGEAVPIVTPAPAAGKDPEYQTVPDADLTDGDKRVIGIALVSMAPLANADSDGFLGSVSVVTSGPTPALVMGPCKVGDSLCLAATPTDKASWSTTGKYLKVGNGCFTAMDAITTAVLQTIMVNVGGSGSGSEMLYIIAVHPTYLECNTLADDSGDSYSVARPHLLRSTDTAARAVTDQAYTLTKSAFTDGVYTGDGQKCTGTRSPGGAGNTEDLVVTEPYLIGDVIEAFQCNTGLTDALGEPITLMDQNVSSRHWAAKNLT
jgi:hypothetical protein